MPRIKERLVDQVQLNYGREDVVKALERTLQQQVVTDDDDNSPTTTSSAAAAAATTIVGVANAATNVAATVANVTPGIPSPTSADKDNDDNNNNGGDETSNEENKNGSEQQHNDDEMKKTTTTTTDSLTSQKKLESLWPQYQKQKREQHQQRQQQQLSTTATPTTNGSQIVFLSGWSGLSMSKLCDMVYSEQRQRQQFETTTASCWYTCTKFSSSSSATAATDTSTTTTTAPVGSATTENNSRSSGRYSSTATGGGSGPFGGVVGGIVGGAGGGRRKSSNNNNNGINVEYATILASLVQLVSQVDTYHRRKDVISKLRFQLTIDQYVEFMTFCPDMEKLQVYSTDEIHALRTERRLDAITGFFQRPIATISATISHKVEQRRQKEQQQRQQQRKHNTNDGTDDGVDDDNSTTSPIINRLYGMIKMFFQTLVEFQPIVWAFEDLQFAILSHHDKIPRPVKNPTTTTMTASTAKTQNESDENDSIQHSSFKKWINQFDHAIKLSITNMSKDDISKMLQHVLRSDDVEDLADLMYQRTNGNDHFVLQLLDQFQEEDLITFSTWTYQWQWDIDEIKRKSMITDNVLAFVEKRLSQLSRPVQRCLQLASHVGYRFDEDLLAKVIRSEFVQQSHEMKDYIGKTRELLQVGLDGNFIERIDMDEGGNRYKFVHNQVQIACQRLFEKRVTRKDVEKLHWNVGAALWRGWRDSESYAYVPNRVIFPCVKEINLGQLGFILRTGTREQIMNLNYEAAKRSYALQAYFPAASYLECAVRLHKLSDWTDSYGLTLELHTALAQMSLASGQLDRIPAIVKRVNIRAQNDEDKLAVEMVELHWLKMVGRLDEGVSKSVSMLNRLGVRLKSGYFKYQSKRKKNRIKRALYAMSDEDIKRKCNLISSDVRDGTILRVEQQLIHTLLYLYRREERPEIQYPNLAAVLVCKMMESVLSEHGMPDCSLAALTSMAAVYADYDTRGTCLQRMCRSITCSHESSDMDLAIRLMELALSLPIDEKSPYMVASIGLIKHWRAPLTQCTETNLKGYDIGMKSGDLKIAFMCAWQYIIDYFLAGLPLNFLIKDVESILSVMIEYGQKFYARKMFPFYQLLLNISGASSHILDIGHGVAIDRMKSLRLRLENDQTEPGSLELILYLHCQEYGLATKVFEAMKNLDVGGLRFQAEWHVRVFEFALICIHNASDIKSILKRRYWKKLAMEYVSMIQVWVETYKAINLGHKLGILKAAMMSFQSPSPSDAEIVAAYDECIARSARSGFLQDAALTAVLASKVVKNDVDKHQYAVRAMELYSSWDAAGIVQHLQKKYRHFKLAAGEIDFVKQHGSGAGVKGRQRFSDDEGIMKVHRSLNAAEDRARKENLLERPSDATVGDQTTTTTTPFSKSFVDYPVTFNSSSTDGFGGGGGRHRHHKQEQFKKKVAVDGPKKRQQETSRLSY